MHPASPMLETCEDVERGAMPRWLAAGVVATLALVLLRRQTNRLNSTRLTREKALLALALVAELVALPFMLLWPARVRRTVEVHGTRRDLAARMRSLARFAQPAWLGHSFVELIFTSYVVAGRIEKASEADPDMFVRRELRTADGGVLGLDWFRATPEAVQARAAQARALGAPRPTIALILPGMNCDALSHCEHNLASELHAVGITPVVYLRRGIGYTRPNPLQTSKPYCLRGSEDIHVVAMHLRQHCPDARLVAVGCSTGGAIIRTYISARALARRDALASVAALGGEQPPDAVGDVMSGHGFDAFATFDSG